MNPFEAELRALIEKHRDFPGVALVNLYEALEEVTAELYGELKALGPFAPRGGETEDI